MNKKKSKLPAASDLNGPLYCVCICNVIVTIFIDTGKVVSSPLAFIYMVVCLLLAHSR